MPASSLKKIYLAKSLPELDLKTTIESDVQKRSSKLVANSASKVFLDAEKYFAEHDEEKAYVQYMRFVELVLMLQKRPDFKKDDSIHLLEKANIALSKADQLKKSLKNRYSELSVVSPTEVQKNIIIKELPKAKSEVSSVVLEEQNEIGQEKKFITSADLLAYISSPQTSLVIMDIRPRKDFLDSHIKHSCCINIPQEILNPGLTAAKLESLLPKESLSLWYKRAEVDWVVIMDFDTKNEGLENKFFTVLRAALSKWDQKCLKKAPVVLKGGYSDWMAKFPMYTTKVIHFDPVSDLKISPVIANLADIEYPNLDENDSVEHLNEKNSKDQLFRKTFVPTSDQNGISTSKPSENRKSFSAPTIDRNSKPSIDVNNKPNLNSNRVLSYSGVNRKIIQAPEKKKPPPVDRASKTLLLNFPADKKSSRYVLDSSDDDDLLVESEKPEFIKSNKIKASDEELKKNMILNEINSFKKIVKDDSNNQNEKSVPNVNKEALTMKQQEKSSIIKNNEESSPKIMRKVDEKENTLISKEKPSVNEREDLKNTNISLMKRDVSSAKPILSGGSSSYCESKKNNFDASNSVGNSSSSPPKSAPVSTGSPSKGLVRSHSSPNITQLLEDEENRQVKIPAIDRSLKPKMTNAQLSEVNRARQRNMNPVYGNCPVRSATGLKNLGNTCFMNSVIQCLSNTAPLADYIMTGQYVDHVSRNYKHGTGGELVEEFAAVIRALWMGQYKSIYPRDFKNTVSKCLSVCIGNEQQDSHEFLVLLLEKLHADLNRSYMKVPPKLDPNCNETAFWQHHKSCNSSKISDVFDGMLRSTLTCLSCGKVSHSFEVTSCLSLPISTSKCSLKDCFQNFLRPERISGEAAWDCPRCKQKKEAEKRLSICRLPEVLIIQLKRFSYEGLWRRKLQSHVEFDLNFNVPYEENSREYSRSYSLYGIVNHYGTMEGGHYTAFCKTNSGKWFKYDDHEVSEISSSDIKTSAAYLLFYIAADFQSRL